MTTSLSQDDFYAQHAGFQLGSWRWAWLAAGLLMPVLSANLGHFAADDSIRNDGQTISASHGIVPLVGGVVGLLIGVVGLIVLAWGFNLFRPVEESPGRAVHALIGLGLGLFVGPIVLMLVLSIGVI